MKRPVNLLLLVLVVVCAVSVWHGRGERGGFDLPLLSWRGSGAEPTAGAPAPIADTRRGTIAPIAQLPAAADSRRADEPPPPATIHLVVLNGTDQSGLANEVSLVLPLLGCVVERVGNAPHNDHARSLLVNRRLDSKTAAALAGRLGGLPVLREADSRTTEDAVLVLGQDHEHLLRRLDQVRRRDR